MEIGTDLETLKLLLNCPRLYISNYFSDLKTEVDQAFNQYFITLNNHFNTTHLTNWVEIIKQIELFEKDCLSKQKTNQFKSFLLKEINVYLDLIQVKLDSNPTRCSNSLTKPNWNNTSCINNLSIYYKLKQKDELNDLINECIVKIERVLFQNQTILFIADRNKVGKLLIIQNEYLSKQLRQLVKNETVDFVPLLSNELLKSAYLKELLKSNCFEDILLMLNSKHLLNEIKFECVASPESDINNEIPGNLFDGFNCLKDISFCNNQIDLLNEAIFNGLNALKVVDLSHNRLRQLDSNLFNGLLSLNELNLAHNQLTSIDRNQFRNLCNLEILNFSNNLLTFFDCKILNDCVNLEEIYLYSNQIENFFSKWPSKLKIINLSNNKIKNLNSDCFSSLFKVKYIGLSFNLLTRLESNIFNDLVSLEIFDLAGNRLKDLNNDVFSCLNNLIKIDLSYNELNWIYEDLFSGLFSLKEIHLSNNEFCLNELKLRIETNVRFVSFKTEQNQNDYKSVIQI